MSIFWYRVKRLLLSGSLRFIFLFFTVLTAAFTVVTFHFRARLGGTQEWGQFWWQACLGVFSGLFVGYIVDAATGWGRIRFVAKFFAGFRPGQALPVVVATLHSNNKGKATGPGETVGIGLLFGAYSTIFSSDASVVSSKNISVIASEDITDLEVENYHGQRVIFGGPRHNKLTRNLLDLPKLLVHYPPDGKGSFCHRLETKPKKTRGNMVWNPDDHICNNTLVVDYGLVVKLGRQLHVSGCHTWGVIGAATCIFSEGAATLLVSKLEKDGIDPSQDNYFAVIKCEIPSVENQYSIGEIVIMYVEAIDQ